MDEQVRKLERSYQLDPEGTWLPLIRARIRAHLPIDDLAVYRVYWNNIEQRNILAQWNWRPENTIKIDKDLWHYPIENNSVVVWPGFRGEKSLFERLLDNYGLRWEYEHAKPYPESEFYDYSQRPEQLRNPSRIRKMVIPKKAKSTKPRKYFGDPNEPPIKYSEEELTSLKEHYFYNLGQHLLFPEFPTGCRECGNQDNHQLWCSHYPRKR